MADDADDLAPHIEHRSTRVALIDGGIRLQEFHLLETAEELARRPAAADMPGCQRVGDAVGRADDEYLVADHGGVGVAEDHRVDAGGTESALIRATSALGSDARTLAVDHVAGDELGP